MAGNIKHVVVLKFKERVDRVVMEDFKKGTEKMAQIDSVKSFEWGADLVSSETLTQGFTHSLLVTFESSEALQAFYTHPAHEEFVPIFHQAVEKYLVLDFPSVLVKPPAPPSN